MNMIKNRKFDWGGGVISSSWLWVYNVFCIDPPEQTAAAWLHSKPHQNTGRSIFYSTSVTICLQIIQQVFLIKMDLKTPGNVLT